MTHANILTARQRCLRDCSRTFTGTHGAAIPGGPFPGTHGQLGDMRRCWHGRLWRYLGADGASIDVWESVSWFWTPVVYLRAIRVRPPVEEHRHDWDCLGVTAGGLAEYECRDPSCRERDYEPEDPMSDEDSPLRIDSIIVPPGTIARMRTSGAGPSPALREAIDRAKQRHKEGLTE